MKNALGESRPLRKELKPGAKAPGFSYIRSGESKALAKRRMYEKPKDAYGIRLQLLCKGPSGKEQEMWLTK